MNKKPLWRRVNRGVVVSLAALIAVVLYVLAGYILQASDRKAIQALTESYHKISESTSMLTEAQIAELKSEEGLKAKKTELKNSLIPLFVPGSGYLDSSVSTLFGTMESQLLGVEQVTSRRLEKKSKVNLIISEDVAKSTASYRYLADGKVKNIANGKLEDFSGYTQISELSIIFKKVNGEWKIYRIGHNSWWLTDRADRY